PGPHRPEGGAPPPAGRTRGGDRTGAQAAVIQRSIRLDDDEVLRSPRFFRSLLEPSGIGDPHNEPVVRVLFTFTGTTLGASTAHADVTCVETGETWTVALTAEIIERPSAAVALVLDRSKSMNEESGIAPGIKRADVLRFSAPPCITVLDDEHAAMVLGF